MKKIDHAPPTFPRAALWDLLFQQIKVCANHAVFSVCIRFREETLSPPMIIINHLKPQKAEFRADGHPQEKEERSSPRGSSPSGKEASWEARLTLGGGSSHPPSFGVGGRGRCWAEGRVTPSCPGLRSWRSEYCLQPQGAHEIKNEAGVWNPVCRFKNQNSTLII